MSNIVLSYLNRFDLGTYSGGSYQATAPLNNVKTLKQGLVARSTNALLASTKFGIDLGNETTPIRIVGIMKHNMSINARIRIACGTTPGGNQIYDSGFFAVWPRIYEYTDLDWESPNFWTGQIDASEISSYQIKSIFELGQNFTGRYWTFEINDTANAAGHIDLSRVWGGPAFVVKYNMDYGEELTWEARDIAQESYGGARYVSLREARRIYRFAFNALTDNEAYGRALEIQRVCRNEGEIVVIPDPENISQAHRRNLFGRLRRYDPIRHALLGVHETSFEVEEFLL